jgi:hypothetical protein
MRVFYFKTMKKLTKRKGFNFLRSYFDVLNELQNDTDKVNFLLSIINKQFLNESPDGLNFIVNLCYESQRHQIESSVKGWERAANDTLGTTLVTTLGTTPMTTPKELEEKEELKEKEKVKGEKPKKVFTAEINQCYEDTLQYFTNNLHPKNEKEKFLWLDTIEKLERIDEIPLSWTLHIVKRTREDVFWVKNFLSITKLRKKNSDGKLWAEVFIEKFRTRKAPEDIEMDRLRLKYTGNGE